MTTESHDVALVFNDALPENTITFNCSSGEVARISADGVMRFTIEANDENAAKFVNCIEGLLRRRLTGLDVLRSEQP